MFKRVETKSSSIIGQACIDLANAFADAEDQATVNVEELVIDIDDRYGFAADSEDEATLYGLAEHFEKAQFFYRWCIGRRDEPVEFVNYNRPGGSSEGGKYRRFYISVKVGRAYVGFDPNLDMYWAAGKGHSELMCDFYGCNTIEELHALYEIESTRVAAESAARFSASPDGMAEATEGATKAASEFVDAIEAAGLKEEG